MNIAPPLDFTVTPPFPSPDPANPLRASALLTALTVSILARIVDLGAIRIMRYGYSVNKKQNYHVRFCESNKDLEFRNG